MPPYAFMKHFNPDNAYLSGLFNFETFTRYELSSTESDKCSQCPYQQKNVPFMVNYM
jgi:hypothetical protein